jgi:hypothetical protein
MSVTDQIGVNGRERNKRGSFCYRNGSDNGWPQTAGCVCLGQRQSLELEFQGGHLVTAHVSRCIFHRRAARSGPSATGTGAAPVAGSYAGDGIAGLGGDSSAYFDLPCGWTRGDAWADLSDDGSQHMDPDGVMDHSALNLDLNDSLQWLTCPLGPRFTRFVA